MSSNPPPILPLVSTSTRPGELRTTGFGPTVFDSLASTAPRRPSSVFDVCHVGLVLRAVLFVQAVVAVGVVFVAATPRGWLEQFAGASGVALPGVLLWLMAACALKRPLGALAPPLQFAVATALGALCGLVGLAMELPLELDLPGSAQRGWAWLNNDWVNFISATFSAVLAAALWSGLPTG